MSTTLAHMPQPLTAETLSHLASVEGPGCLSIFMPTHRSGGQTQQSPIRFGNLFDQARERWKKAGHDVAELEPLSALQTGKTIKNDFWQHQGEGLALFVHGDHVHAIELPYGPDESVHVGETFYLKPLLVDEVDLDSQWVLTLSWDEAAMFRVSGDSVESVASDQFPVEFDDLITPRDPEEQLQYSSHQAVGGSPGTATAMYHGHDEGEGKIEADRRNYLIRVGERVAEVIYSSGRPLIVIGTEEVVGHFDAATVVPLAEKIHTSPAELQSREIADLVHQGTAKSINATRFAARFNEDFGTAAANGKASSDLQEIVIAAINGQVQRAIVIADRNAFGEVDLESQKVHVNGDTPADPHSTELTNQVVVSVLTTGGEVRVCDADRLPNGCPLAAAIYRY